MNTVPRVAAHTYPWVQFYVMPRTKRFLPEQRQVQGESGPEFYAFMAGRAKNHRPDSGLRCFTPSTAVLKGALARPPGTQTEPWFLC